MGRGSDWVSSTYSGAVVTYEYPNTSVPPVTAPATFHRQHKGLITTNAVKTRGGWLGQVLVDQKIVWEAEPEDKREAALELADDRVAVVLGELFA